MSLGPRRAVLRIGDRRDRGAARQEPAAAKRRGPTFVSTKPSASTSVRCHSY